MEDDRDNETRNSIQRCKIRRLFKELESVRGYGCSLISIIIPPRKEISHVTKMLADEYQTYSTMEPSPNVERERERLSIVNAITSAQEQLKRYDKVPSNGLVLYSGTILACNKVGTRFSRRKKEDGEVEIKVAIDFEPFMPIKRRRFRPLHRGYMFYIEVLRDLIEYSDEQFGIIVFDSTGTLFGRLIGSRRRVHAKYGLVDLETVANIAKSFYKGQVKGIILAVSSESLFRPLPIDVFPRAFPEWLLDLFMDPVITIDPYRADTKGLDLAIKLSELEYDRENRLLDKYFNLIRDRPAKCTKGYTNSLQSSMTGMVETLIFNERLLDKIRYMVNINKGESKPKNEEKMTLLEWLEKDNLMTMLDMFSPMYKEFGGCVIECVSSQTKRGRKLRRDCEGVGAILR